MSAACCRLGARVDVSGLKATCRSVAFRHVSARGLSQYWVPTRSCRLPGHPHSCVEYYVRLRERRQWDSD
ncbi:hypothetical protein Taro_014659 [Colocasia esculenta]|uniref:Uncharacterized protein n=1 Tax=Colocasia esculenta TaxID=4460 RepID=A0A843UQT3_COLES|nr:hypothetical protein [Colocasia esculenta]